MQIWLVPRCVLRAAPRTQSQPAGPRAGQGCPWRVKLAPRFRGASQKKKLFGPKKKKKLALFAQRKDFLRFRVGFCSKKTGNRRKKTSSPLPRSKNRGASPIRQWQPQPAAHRRNTCCAINLLAACIRALAVQVLRAHTLSARRRSVTHPKSGRGTASSGVKATARS